MSNYDNQAREAARDFVEEDMLEYLVDRAAEGSPLPKFLGEYPERGYDFDSSLFERVSDTWYQPADAVEVMEDLSEFDASDEGLCEGVKSWRDLLNCTAGWTYIHAVESYVNRVLSDLKDEVESREQDDDRPVEPDEEYAPDTYLERLTSYECELREWYEKIITEFLKSWA